MVTIKTRSEVELMAEAGQRLARILHTLAREVRAGMRTKELDTIAHDLILAGGDVPAFLGYVPGGTAKPFPAALCVSVNDTVVHGVPGDYVLRDGDLVKLDLGLVHKGFYSDAAVTVGVGNVSEEGTRLIKATEEALRRGIMKAIPGNTVGDVGHAVEECVWNEGFSVVRSLAGHGIGRALHENPMVFNFGKPGEGEALRAGMVIAIEPMVATGNGKTKQAKDDSFMIADGSISAHFEHTVAITENGPRILTVIE